MIQTSYFSSGAPRARMVAICKAPPKGWSGPCCPALAPSMIGGAGWSARYHHDLCRKFPDGRGLLEVLERIEAETPDAILTCYERNPRDCHRHVLVRYVQHTVGILIPEWSNPQEWAGLW